MREFLFSSNGCSSWESLPRWGWGRGWGCRQCVGLCLSPWIQSVTEYVRFFSIVKTYVFLQNYGKVIKKPEVNFPITAMNKMLISFFQAEQKVNTLNDKFKWKKNQGFQNHFSCEQHQWMLITYGFLEKNTFLVCLVVVKWCWRISTTEPSVNITWPPPR